MSDNIKVAIRVRPLIKKEIEDGLKEAWQIDSETRSIKSNDNLDLRYNEEFTFDHIFDKWAGNEYIYDEIVSPMVDLYLEGYNCTIFAYGQTSSGKTHTMNGCLKDPGLIERVANALFEAVHRKFDYKFLFRVAYVEIYNEKIFDLLKSNSNEVRIREDIQGNITLEAQEKITSCSEQLIQVMALGNRNRKNHSTKMNINSSRSHAIFRITMECSKKTDTDSQPVKICHFNLVDLAGSERFAQTQTTGQRFKEGTFINKSLTTLGLVISQLAEMKPFVSYRDSKLTLILRSSLGGNAKTLFIVNITPVSSEDTYITLSFAKRAKTIKNKPCINTVSAKSSILVKYHKEIQNLKEELSKVVEVNRGLTMDRHIQDKYVGVLENRIKLLNMVFASSDGRSRNKRRHTIGSGPKNLEKRILTYFPIDEIAELDPQYQALNNPIFSDVESDVFSNVKNADIFHSDSELQLSDIDEEDLCAGQHPTSPDFCKQFENLNLGESPIKCQIDEEDKKRDVNKKRIYDSLAKMIEESSSGDNEDEVALEPYKDAKISSIKEHLNKELLEEDPPNERYNHDFMTFDNVVKAFKREVFERQYTERKFEMYDFKLKEINADIRIQIQSELQRTNSMPALSTTKKFVNLRKWNSLNYLKEQPAYHFIEISDVRVKLEELQALLTAQNKNIQAMATEKSKLQEMNTELERKINYYNNVLNNLDGENPDRAVDLLSPTKEELSLENEQLRNTIDTYQQLIHSLNNKIDHNEMELEVIYEIRDNLIYEREHISQKNRENEVEIERLKNNLIEADIKLMNFAEFNEKLTIDLEYSKNAPDKHKITQESEKLKNQLDLAIKEKMELEKINERLQMDVFNYIDALAKVNNTCTTYNNEIRSLKLSKLEILKENDSNLKKLSLALTTQKELEKENQTIKQKTEKDSDVYDLTIKNFTEQVTRLEKEIELKNKIQSDFEEKVRTSDSQIKILTEKLKIANDTYNKLDEEFNAFKLEYISEQKAREHQEKNYKDLEKSVIDKEKSIKSVKMEIEKLMDEIKRKNEQISTLMNDNAVTEDKLRLSNVQILSLRENIQDLRNRNNSLHNLHITECDRSKMYEKTIEENKKEIAKLKHAEVEFRRTMQQLENRMNNAVIANETLSKQHNQFMVDLDCKSKNLAKAIVEKSELSQKLNAKNLVIKDLKVEVNRSKENQECLESQIFKMEENVKILTVKVANLETENLRLQETIVKCNTEIRNLVSRNENIQMEIEHKQAKRNKDALEVLQNVKNNLNQMANEEDITSLKLRRGEELEVKLSEKEKEIDTLKAQLTEANVRFQNTHKELQRSKARCDCSGFTAKTSPFNIRRMKKNIIQDTTRRLPNEDITPLDNREPLDFLQNDDYKAKYEALLAQMKDLKESNKPYADTVEKQTYFSESTKESESCYYKYNQLKDIARMRLAKIKDLEEQMEKLNVKLTTAENSNSADNNVILMKYTQLKAIARKRHEKIIQLEDKLKQYTQPTLSGN